MPQDDRSTPTKSFTVAAFEIIIIRWHWIVLDQG
jgi:hypothetical protein